MCKIASRNLLYDAGSSKPVLCDDLDGWNGEMGGSRGTYVYLWLIHVDVWKKSTQYCKAIILQLKRKKGEKKKRSNNVLFNLLEELEKLCKIDNKNKSFTHGKALIDISYFSFHQHSEWV